MDTQPEQSTYATRRAKLIYYFVVERIATAIAADAKSIIDVGSHETPCLEWFSPKVQRYSLDLRRPYRAEGITSIKTDFLNWAPPKQFDVALCLQVLEHVRDARAFAQKLLSIANTVIISVPYKWKQGRTKSHVHDPVDEAKVLQWFGREPHFRYICREIGSSNRRMICVYDHVSIPRWANTRQRTSLLKDLAG